MKQRTFIFSLLLSFCLCASGQQPESLYSHVSKRIYLDGNGTSHIDNVTYLDGFGRKSQETGISGTPDGTGDLILPYRYGQGGRTEFEYLPYPKTGNGGAYDPTYLLPANWNAYGGQDAGYAYSLTEYECSPLDRITRKTGPGAAWHTSGKSVSYSYAMNETGEVPLYRISLSGMPVAGGHYGAGSLRKVTATDEDGRTTETFTDNAGRTVLTVAADGSARFLTCRVYDDHGRLRWVLPPEAVRLLSTGASSSQLHGTAWYYEYDRLGRQTFHRAPGCDPVYTVYDNNDRPVLVQDGNLRARNAALWEYRRYDGAGRLTESGELLLTSASTHASLQALLLQGGELPQGTCTPLQYTVYDSYTSVAGFSPHAFQAVSGYSGDYHREVVGLTAYTCSRVLGTDEWTVTAYYYDEQCRVIQTVSNMLRGGLYRTDTAYDFTGRMLKCREAYDGRTMENTYVYDSRSRLLSVSASLNGNAPVSLIRNEYDGVGRLKSVTHNEKANLKTEYSYNIRSWVTNMSNPLYSQTLTYGYGGNISSQQWVQDSKTRKYTYTYDGLNRLTHAAYTGDGNYTANYSYDNMGNITSLKRYDVSLVDNLTYTYNGNQLTKVEDATSNAFGFANGASTTNEYTYDANGNLTKDSNKGIASITYNSLNLPQVVTFSNGNTITYLYNADGRKLRTIHVTNGTATTTDYCGNVIYENGTARLLLTETGYIDLSDNSYHYYIKDHLGNNRVVADANGTVEESNQYYPFGLNYANAGSNLQPYKYNGKELDTKNGLNWYDYRARHYDAALGRWHVVDPLAEKIYSWSPYGYCLNNPVKYVDPTGCFASTHTDFLGNVIAVFNDGDLGVYRHDTDKEGVQIKLEKEYSPDNTSANGKKMGETYEWDSFVEPISKEPLGQIDFNSFKASQKVFSSLRTLTKLQPNSIKLLMYAFNANNTEGFDIKTENPYFGSQFGNNKYISMRDAGNILAGILARSSGLSANITYTVFGAFQLSGNNRLFLPLYLHKAWSMGVNGSYGETPISHKFQRRGYELDF